MKRLRHPVRAIREPFGTAGLVVACVALIAALGGTALAAKGALTGKQKKEVEKIAKKFAGKPGENGAPGPAGKDGSNGTNGVNGKDGVNGTNGAPGTPGSPGAPGEDGKSVEAISIATGTPQCDEMGGVEYEIEESGSATEICNGKEGSPWTVDNVLPPGATETGTWSFSGQESDGLILSTITFAVPLENKLEAAHVHYLKIGDPATTACPSTSPVFPKAASGELCIYEGATGGVSLPPAIEPPSLAETGEIYPAGGVMLFTPTATPAIGSGSYAVTG